MSKSLGNFVTVRELLEEGYDPSSIRHLLISAHYRSDLNFTRDGLAASANAVQRLVDFAARLETVPTDAATGAGGLARLAAEALDSFRVAMDDDLNTPDALAALFRMVGRVNAELDRRDAVTPAERDGVLDALASMDRVLGLLEVARASRSVDDDVAAWVERKIEERSAARAGRDFAAADAIREELAERGIVLEDGAGGTRWKVVG
jgi:cysteinyl-tRNA synthetase